jgi:hypothetical protein
MTNGECGAAPELAKLNVPQRPLGRAARDKTSATGEFRARYFGAGAF